MTVLFLLGFGLLLVIISCFVHDFVPNGEEDV